MTRLQILTIVGWLLFAAFVIYRCFFTADSQDYDVLFACWCGGVLSFPFFFIIFNRVRARHANHV